MEPIPISPLVPLLAVFAEPLASALAIIVGCTTILGGVGHYGGVLMGKPKTQVEYMTGAGFFGRANSQRFNSVVVLVK
jgi:hypothetical protein